MKPSYWCALTSCVAYCLHETHVVTGIWKPTLVTNCAYMCMGGPPLHRSVTTTAVAWVEIRERQKNVCLAPPWLAASTSSSLNRCWFWRSQLRSNTSHYCKPSPATHCSLGRKDSMYRVTCDRLTCLLAHASVGASSCKGDPTIPDDHTPPWPLVEARPNPTDSDQTRRD